MSLWRAVRRLCVMESLSVSLTTHQGVIPSINYFSDGARATIELRRLRGNVSSRRRMKDHCSKGPIIFTKYPFPHHHLLLSINGTPNFRR